jgi:hypothetical protein
MTRLLALACALVCALAAPAHAATGQEAMFQDDNLLVYGTPDKVAETLDELERLGVDRVRISVFWAVVAPKERPADPSDPAQYPGGSWDRYDTVLRLANERGIGVNFNITTPAPSWATGNPERADIKETYEPDAAEWGRFVKAVGTRYDGAHGPARVDYWSLMNEPNQAGWLTPQWKQRDGKWVEAAPRLYRDMVRTGWQALQDTGHGADTILVGELAPKGLKDNRGETRSIDALRFIRRLYCLDDNLQVLAGSDAEAQGCPPSDQLTAFPAQNPGLFGMTGWAHHPYELLLSPDRRQSWPDWVTTANLDDLQSVLRRIRARYNQAELEVPIYLTEFGYQTRPPDRLAVSPAQQAQYINHAEYLAYRRRDVRTLAQFLLLDDGPPIDRTFQSGLRFRDGRAKPAYRAYQVPIHLPTTRLRRGQRLRVWGGARAAETGTRPAIQVQFRRSGTKRWRRLVTLRGDRTRGYVNTTIRNPGAGSVRLSWNGRTSRTVAVSVRR